MKQSKPAFSLIEMLMALLVASLLLAALAPVMTRKFNENVNVSGIGTYKAPADMQCYSYSDLNPNVKVNINDVYTASFIIASAGGGGAGGTTPKLSELKSYTKASNEIVTDTVTYDNQTINIVDGMTNVKIAYIIGGGGGGGGGSVARPFTPSDSTCSSYGSGKTDTAGNTGAKFSIYDNLALCVTKFNQKYSSGCYTGSSSNCTSSTDMSYTYSGCNRVTCNGLDKIKNICANLTNSTGDYWRYPTLNEIARWGTSTTRWKKLALCAYGASHTVSLCGTYSASSASATSHPYCIFSRAPMPDGTFYASCLTQGSDSYDTNWHAMGAVEGTRPRSVRCVYDGTSALSGAGGSSGSIMSNIDITTYVKKAGTNGKIVYQTGRGGRGGEKATTKATAAKAGSDGGQSCIYVNKPNGERVYALCASGGRGGAVGDITKATAAPKTSTASSCYEWKNSESGWTSVTCSTFANAGAAGTVGKDPEYTVVGGAGGNGSYNQGSGGTGGSALYDSYRNNITSENGSNGVGGSARITYQLEYTAAPGGGGGGGSVVQIKDVLIGNKAECTLVIGKGGKGGNVDNNGEDGGLSSVKCNSDARTFEVPGGKGGKIGISASNSTSNPTVGTKGLFGDVTKITNTAIKDYNQSKKVISKGGDGKDGIYDETLKQGIGGRGGKSGTGTFGGCGGLYIENDEKEGICKINNSDIKRIEGKGFSYDDTLVPSPKDIQNTDKPSFGKAGSGGGGGGWIRELGPGKGGDGMNGYVCVYWYNE